MVTETIAAFGGGVFVGVIAWKIIAANIQGKKKQSVNARLDSILSSLNSEYGTERTVAIPGGGESTIKTLPDVYLGSFADINIGIREI